MNNEVNASATPPRMMTIRQIAATGLMGEHTLRMMAKAGQLPCITVGETRKILVNYDKLLTQLANL